MLIMYCFFCNFQIFGINKTPKLEVSNNKSLIFYHFYGSWRFYSATTIFLRLTLFILFVIVALYVHLCRSPSTLSVQRCLGRAFRYFRIYFFLPVLSLKFFLTPRHVLSIQFVNSRGMLGFWKNCCTPSSL